MKDKYLEELLEMMKKFINNNYEPEQFSFDLEAKLFDKRIEPYWDIVDELPMYCGLYDDSPELGDGLIGADELRKYVEDAYNKLVQHQNISKLKK